MSYIQQNFNQTQSLNLTITSRLRQLWVWRNLLMLSVLYKDFINSSTTIKLSLVWLLRGSFFKIGIEGIYKKINTKNFLFYELNLVKSLKYWNLKISKATLDNILLLDNRFDVSDNSINNQYFTILPVISIKVAQLNYRSTLFKMFESLLRFYYFPNKSYTNKIFRCVTSTWLTLKYYNCYFFKIYNF